MLMKQERWEEGEQLFGDARREIRAEMQVKYERFKSNCYDIKEVQFKHYLKTLANYSETQES